MKVTVNENSEIILKEVYNGIGLESNAGEQFSICMRDSGFEFSYGNKRSLKIGTKYVKQLTNTAKDIQI